MTSPEPRLPVPSTRFLERGAQGPETGRRGFVISVILCIVPDRGEYRGIYCVLVDGPQFQQLTLGAQVGWFILKLRLGHSGIGIMPSPAAEISEPRTRLTIEQAFEAVAELRATGWIRTEGSVIWLVRGLEFAPGLSPDNANHRTALAKHLASLPNLRIKQEFMKQYPEWCRGIGVGIPDPMPDPIPDPIPHPIEMASPIKEKEILKEKEIKNSPHRAGVRDSLPEPARESFDGLLRACRNPDALAAEVGAIAQGLRTLPGQPTPTWDQIGLALSDMALNGERPTALALRAFVGRVVRDQTDPAPARNGNSRGAPVDDTKARMDAWVRRKNLESGLPEYHGFPPEEVPK